MMGVSGRQQTLIPDSSVVFLYIYSLLPIGYITKKIQNFCGGILAKLRESQYTRYHITGKSFESGRLEEASFSKGEINYGRKNDAPRSGFSCYPDTACIK